MNFLAVAQKLWRKLNLRGMIILSLSLQVILIFLAPIRKRRSKRSIMMLTWSAYLVADWVADYAFGLIAKAQFNCGTSEYEDDVYVDLLAFWAPFLLLHLGGPDTITAFALEDNELWRRHMLNLLFQLGAAGYVFYQSLPNNKLIVPTILMFIGGIIKYIERTRALYLGSFKKFRASLLTFADASPNYTNLMEEYSSKEKNKTSDDRVVAFSYFSIFKGLLVDLSFRERDESMEFFGNRSAKDAFLIIEAELNFFYDVLYTKAAVIHCPAGYLFRAISIGSIIAAFAFFYVLNKQSFHEYDIKITYTLLLGAVGLEFVALSMLICSDWTIALLGRPEKDGRRSPIKSTFMKFLLKFKYENSPFALHTLYARWSKSISQYDLIYSQLERWPKWIEKFLDFVSLRELFDDWKFRGEQQYDERLGELIFNTLMQKSVGVENPERLNEMCASRGKWALEKRVCKDLLPYVSNVDYGESLLLWHIATNLCYYTDEERGTNDRSVFSVILSNYMLHLMIKQPNMMSSAIGIGEIRFRDTCVQMDECEKMFRNACAEMDKRINEVSKGNQKELTMMNACRRLLSTPIDMEGDRSKSVLFDAFSLAKELQNFGETKWKILSEVWVELLGYAAIHCRPYNHAQQLSKGGELVTLVWLLMVHIGLSEQFQIVEDQAREKPIV